MLNRASLMLIVATLAAVFALGSRPVVSGQEDERGQSVRVRISNGETFDLYDESHALVIGVSKYDGGWRRLPSVERDVTAVSAVLKRQGFSVTLVMDPTYENFDRGFDSCFSGSIFRTDPDPPPHGRI